MKQLFNINPVAAQNCNRLLCEFSHYHLCLGGADDSGQIQFIQYFEKATPVTADDRMAVLQSESIDIKRFKSLLMGSALPDAELVPQALADSHDLSSFLQKESNTNLHTDALPEQALQVVYSIPSHWQQVAMQAPQTTFLHVHTAAIRAAAHEEGNNLLLHFDSREFRVVAMKSGKVQLAQVYPFATPLDVVYYLLMIGAQYNMPQQETHILLSGLVESSSALFKELQQYYTQIRFAKPDGFALPDAAFQPHFFSSLYNLAACASLVEN